MTTMVERVARAIQRRSETAGRGPEDGDLRTAPLSDRVCRDLARAAIGAMREPTEAMVTEARRLNHPRDRDVWRTMIDAALTEAEESEGCAS